MKVLQLVFVAGWLLILASINSCNKGHVAKKSSEERVLIHVTSTSSYCGGARPPEEMLEELRTPKPIGKKEFVLRRGKDNDTSTDPIWTGFSDEDGRIQLTLAPGNYCLVSMDKKDNTFMNQVIETYAGETEYYSAVDRNCLEAWIKRPELSFTVNAGVENVFTVNLHQPCSWNAIPCVQYKGPLPG